jgi:hypothetical protein
MKTIEQIVAAASGLDATQFLKLRRKLDRLENKLWETELAATSAKMAKARITDKDIDRMVMKRRGQGGFSRHLG